ncbi:precorrin-6A synthase (deacetylating) [Bosea sp. BK604]|uniref:precorrin-6A synthase (deacetylating) n=1 Tax=Bosea sp. BK604 TaxID=2512180 RepID=UPI0010468B28|nr:precorrin-6A synthase (deacetylating) [Bosea sp. BK604]TCR67051.1 precorrin-6A synthase (deacetylating) [Bosea sp. BK604]
MRRILVIGIGAGNPDYLTIQAIAALNKADVFFIPDKGEEKAALRQLRTDILDRFVENKAYRSVVLKTPKRAEAGSDYRGAVDDWHAKLAEAYGELFTAELGEDQCGALLVWGDPSLYDSTLRIIERIRATGIALDYEVIPGITSIQALAARHRIPLNRIGEPVLITTGRKLPSNPAEDTVVMLDGEQAFTRVTGNYEIFWGAYLGAPEEILVSGKLGEVSEEIERVRREAREAKGWIMDTYLLRKATPDND